jgi:hypothetical protein
MMVVYDPRHTGAYLLGSQAPITLSPAALQAVFDRPVVRADLRNAPDYPVLSTAQWVSKIRSSIWLTDNQVNAYTGSGPMITDDHPVIEYFLLDGFGSATGRTRVLVHRLAWVVTALLVLLIIGAAVDAITSRRRIRAAI